jgi:hypothetical protein
VKRFGYLPLAIWVGAMICASYTAGRVFGMLDDNELAGDVMAGIFRTVDYLGLVAAGLAAVVSFRSRARLVIAIVLLLGVGVSVFVLNPQIVAGGDIKAVHRTATILWSCLMVGGLILAGMGPPRADSRAS